MIFWQNYVTNQCDHMEEHFPRHSRHHTLMAKDDDLSQHVQDLLLGVESTILFYSYEGPFS